MVLFFFNLAFSAKAQSTEAQQLLLNWEKLTQFKKILSNMYDGYQILHKGYTAVKEISEGNFNLHNLFLDGLMQVSPVVKKYRRVADILRYQVRIVKASNASFNEFKRDQQFSVEEINYLGKVYSNLFEQTLKNLDELTLVITAGKLRMSDDERLQAIDRIYGSMVDQYAFLEDFNSHTALLSIQRKSEQATIQFSKKLNGVPE